MHLQAILPGRSALNSGFTFNRVVKVLNVNGLLPADFGQISYGLMKAQQKAQLHNIIKALNQENNGRDLFDKLQDAITNKVEVPAAIRDSDSEGGIVVNRWALMCESDVHSSSCEELTKYFTKLTADERPGVLTDGIGNWKKKLHRTSGTASSKSGPLYLRSITRTVHFPYLKYFYNCWVRHM